MTLKLLGHCVRFLVHVVMAFVLVIIGTLWVVVHSVGAWHTTAQGESPFSAPLLFVAVGGMLVWYGWRNICLAQMQFEACSK